MNQMTLTFNHVYEHLFVPETPHNRTTIKQGRAPLFLWNLNPVSGGQCHFIQLTILRKYSWPSLAYMFTKVA